LTVRVAGLEAAPPVIITSELCVKSLVVVRPEEVPEIVNVGLPLKLTVTVLAACASETVTL
jgi:hypothetical protein